MNIKNSSRISKYCTTDDRKVGIVITKHFRYEVSVDVKILTDTVRRGENKRGEDELKVRYKGPTFGIDGLTNNREYVVLAVDDLTGALRLIDDSGEDYLYSPTEPGPISNPNIRGRFEILEDDEHRTLAKAIGNYV